MDQQTVAEVKSTLPILTEELSEALWALESSEENITKNNNKMKRYQTPKLVLKHKQLLTINEKLKQKVTDLRNQIAHNKAREAQILAEQQNHVPLENNEPRLNHCAVKQQALINHEMLAQQQQLQKKLLLLQKKQKAEKICNEFGKVFAVAGALSVAYIYTTYKSKTDLNQGIFNINDFLIGSLFTYAGQITGRFLGESLYNVVNYFYPAQNNLVEKAQDDTLLETEQNNSALEQLEVQENEDSELHNAMLAN